MTLGFLQSGAFQVVLAVEQDLDAANTYASNFGHKVVQDDIRNVLQRHRFPQADVVIGGPPCQGFSQLGRRDPCDGRNHLWREFLEVVKRTQPIAFVIENVPSFLKSSEFGELDRCVATQLSGPGGRPYVLRSGVLNAHDFGVPQRRKRGFVIGAIEAVNPPLAPLLGPLFKLSNPTLDSARVFASLAEPSTTELVGRAPYRGSAIHVGRKPTELSKQRYRHIPQGGNRFDLPVELMSPCWRRKAKGTTDVMGRLDLQKPALTIRTEFFKPEKGRYLHPQFDRAITHLEAARIQTFPDSFGWHGTKISIARQIGNAVPPLLAKSLAVHLAYRMNEICLVAK